MTEQQLARDIRVPSLESNCGPNLDWHSRHKLPKDPSLEQRVKWYMEHARRCPCPSDNADILEELNRRFRGTHQDFWIDFNTMDHRALGLWAVQIATHLLPSFEGQHAHDTRPRDAIRTLYVWVQTGHFSMSTIRAASLGAHAAARTVNAEDKAASFAAHAAGQAVGTAHVPTHAIGTVLYSIRLVASINPTNVKAAVTREREWQTSILPENLRAWVDSWVRRTQQSLPKALRAALEQTDSAVPVSSYRCRHERFRYLTDDVGAGTRPCESAALLRRPSTV